MTRERNGSPVSMSANCPEWFVTSSSRNSTASAAVVRNSYRKSTCGCSDPPPPGTGPGTPRARRRCGAGGGRGAEAGQPMRSRTIGDGVKSVPGAATSTAPSSAASA